MIKEHIEPIENQNSDLTKGSINQHLKRIAIPASIGFLFNTLFNVVDTIYAGRLSTDALAGLTLSFPIFFIIIAVSAGIGNAVSALGAIALGKKDKTSFNQLGFNALILGFISGLLVTLFATSFTEPLFMLIGASGDALDLGVAYTNVIFYGSIFFILNAVLNGLLSAQGNTKTYRNLLIISFFLNLVLDPLFIFGWFGLPRLGVVGVALATVLIQVIGTIYLTMRLIKSEWIDMRKLIRSKFTINTMVELLKQAIPSSLNMATIAIGIFIINFYVLKYGGTEGVAAYGAATRIEQLALLPALGLNVAAMTIAGQNFGAQNKGRILEVFKKSMFAGVMIMIVGAMIIFPLAPLLISIFNNDPIVISIGARYLRIEVLAFVTYVILNISISVLQGIKKPNYAIFMGIYRQALPFALFFLLGTTLKMGLDGVWWGIVIINWSAVIITLYYIKIQLKKLK
ncbi:MAG: MATE family efflux transporter [Acholeplasmataceae bacterium]|nr:MATE family efflux transporter [Acholeplasmataceae bacterium]